MIELCGNWPANAPAPVNLDDCRKVVGMPLPPNVDLSKAKSLVLGFLTGNWPWLDKTGQDLRLYMHNLAQIFAAHSQEAAEHVLDPNKGPTWPDGRPPAPSMLREVLDAFDGRRKAAVRAAEWFLAEAKRREEQRVLDAKIEADRKALREKLGDRTVMDFVREQMSKEKP